MSQQPLPSDFKESVRKACQDQDVDYDEVISSISQAVIGDFLGYNIWTGPGPSYQTLVLDIFAITDKGLFGHQVHSTGVSATAVTFLDAISEIIIVKLNHEVAKYSVLITKYENEESINIFSNEDEIQALRSFCRTLTCARTGLHTTKR